MNKMNSVWLTIAPVCSYSSNEMRILSEKAVNSVRKWSKAQVLVGFWLLWWLRPWGENGIVVGLHEAASQQACPWYNEGRLEEEEDWMALVGGTQRNRNRKSKRALMLFKKYPTASNGANAGKRKLEVFVPHASNLPILFLSDVFTGLHSCYPNNIKNKNISTTIYH